MSGDFNCYNPAWYGPVAGDYRDLIRNASTNSNSLLQWTESHQLILGNIPVVFNHFPRNGYWPSSIDLTWSRFVSDSPFTSWHALPDAGNGLDHTLTYSVLNIALPTFTLHRMFSKCDWNSFADMIRYSNHPGPPTSAADTLAYADFTTTIINKVIEDSTPWSS